MTDPANRIIIERKWLAYAIAAGAVVRFIWFVHGLLDQHFLVTYRLPDDAMYYFTVAKHIVHGHGISFDGIHPTNGFHPLWLVAVLPVFVLNLSGWTSVHVVLLVQSLLDVVVIWLIGRMVIEFTESIEQSIALLALRFALFSYAINPILSLRGINGLETTITEFLLLLWAWQFVRIHQAIIASRKEWLKLGGLSGFLFLARTDAAIIMLVAGCFLLYHRWRFLDSEASGIINAVVLAFLIAAPWLLWNLATFGSIIQTSASAVPFFAMKRYAVEFGPHRMYLHLLLEVTRNLLKPFFYIAWGVPFIALVIWLLRIRRIQSELSAWILAIMPVVLGALTLLAYHSFFRGFIREWYIQEMAGLFAILFGLTFAAVVSTLRTSLRLPLLHFGLASLVILMVMMEIEESGNPHYTTQAAMVEVGVPVVTRLGNSYRVASFNSGFYGYLAPHPGAVQNLDGVINPVAYSYIKSGTLHDYLDQDSIDYILEFRGDLLGYQGVIDRQLLAKFQIDSTFSVPPKNPLVLYHRTGPFRRMTDHAGRF